MHFPIVLCCGTRRALFTNKLSKQWCQITKLYLSVQSFVHVSTQVIELQELACPILMYRPKLFFVVFQKRRCLHKFYYTYCLRIIKVYHLTKFQVLIYSG